MDASVNKTETEDTGNPGIDQPVELVVNNRIFARGEVVTVDGYYGIRITEITSAGERFKSVNA
jgi:hypothetical protein